ncbi:MAG: hypothetical protein EBU92_05845 [Betaproteobacteria bacterium]|nr:hypothetical protein [Betaproteobacteria bacterium]
MTFLQMQDLVLSWLDDPDAGYFTRPQVRVWLNNAQREVQKLVEQAFEGHFVKCVETTTVINQREYELPSDFKRLTRLELVISGSSFQTQDVNLMQKITPNQQDVLPRLGTPQGYYFKGSQLILVPVPDTAKTLRMEYIYRLTDMTLDADVSLIPDEFHEYVALLAARDGFLKDGRDIAPIKDKISDYETNLKRDAEQRNIDQPRTVVQTQFDDSYDEIY